MLPAPWTAQGRLDAGQGNRLLAIAAQVRKLATAGMVLYMPSNACPRSADRGNSTSNDLGQAFPHMSVQPAAATSLFGYLPSDP